MTSTRNKWFRWSYRLLTMAALLGVFLPHTAIAQLTPNSYLPSLRNHVCAGTRNEEMSIGLQLYGSTGRLQPFQSLLQQTNIAWMRQSVLWKVIQPTAPVSGQDPVYDFRSADNHLRAVIDNCVNVIATLDTTALWAATTGDRSPIKPEFLDEYADYVQAMVERYDGDGIDDAPGSPVVTYWEMYNEPDFGSVIDDNQGWGEYGAEYAAMLKAVYPAIKAANPNAQVVFGGIAHNRFIEDGGLFVKSFVDDVLDAGGGEFFDVMNVHHYPNPGPSREQWTESKSSGFNEKIAIINEKLTSRGFNKPLVITEIGWHSNSDNGVYASNDETQGRYMVKLTTQAVANNVLSVIWWTFLDFDDDYPYASGIVTNGTPTAKPSFIVFQQLVKRVGNGEFVRIISAPPTADNDLEVYEFREYGTGKTFYVAWRNPVGSLGENIPFDDSIRINWEAPGNRASIYSKEGTLIDTVVDTDDGADNGRMTIAVGGSPIYIVIEQQ